MSRDIHLSVIGVILYAKHVHLCEFIFCKLFFQLMFSEYYVFPTGDILAISMFIVIWTTHSILFSSAHRVNNDQAIYSYRARYRMLIEHGISNLGQITIT